MSEKITDIVRSLLDGMHTISQSETIVGEPAKLGEATIIPIHRLRVGFVAASTSAGGHASSAEGKTGGRGVGGGAQVDPVAVLAIGPDGQPRLLPVEGEAEGTWQRLLHDAPELLSRVLHKAAEKLETKVSEVKKSKPVEEGAEKVAGILGQGSDQPKNTLPEKS